MLQTRNTCYRTNKQIQVSGHDQGKVIVAESSLHSWLLLVHELVAKKVDEYVDIFFNLCVNHVFV